MDPVELPAAFEELARNAPSLLQHPEVSEDPLRKLEIAGERRSACRLLESYWPEAQMLKSGASIRVVDQGFLGEIPL